MELVLLVWMQKCVGECDGGRQKGKKTLQYFTEHVFFRLTQHFIHSVPGISAWAEALSKRKKKEEELKNLELSSEF